MATLRQQVEQDMGVAGAPAAPRNMLGPRAWKTAVKYWGALLVGFLLGACTAGVLSVAAAIL